MQRGVPVGSRMATPSSWPTAMNDSVTSGVDTLGACSSRFQLTLIGSEQPASKESRRTHQMVRMAISMWNEETHLLFGVFATAVNGRRSVWPVADSGDGRFPRL